jgi:DNA (cytosine-5)-methyltransferase 1
MSLDYLSVCSGIEAASCAWEPLGMRAVGFSDIEPFARAVLRHRYPDVPLFGREKRRDETLEQYAASAGFQNIGANDHGPIDILVAGTPCQSFSIAGLRGGMAESRGNLTLEYLRLAKRKRPRWLAWENVPGVLSINKGRDFGTFLGGLAELGYGFAYRVLDAQFFGVPQRRRRVFVVGHLGSWQRAAAVLFERKSLSRDNPPSRNPGPRASQDLESALACGGTARRTFERQSSGEFNESDVAATMSARDYKDHGDLVGEWPVEVTPTLTTSFAAKWGLEDQHALGGAGLFVPAPIYATDGQANAAFAEDIALSLTATNEQPYVAASNFGVRRLTPRECERLQGFPDDWTRVPNWPGWRAMDATETPESCEEAGLETRQTKGGSWRVKDVDGPRYKALGNSKAVPVVKWIGERMLKVDGIEVVQ